jgi:hypothetical protein
MDIIIKINTSTNLDFISLSTLFYSISVGYDVQIKKDSLFMDNQDLI